MYILRLKNRFINKIFSIHAIYSYVRESNKIIRKEKVRILEIKNIFI